MRRPAALLALALALLAPGTARAQASLDAAALSAKRAGGGVVEGGATVDVVASVRNSGTTPVSGLRGRLSASDGVVVEAGEAAFPDLEPGAVGSNAAAPFRVRLPDGLACGEVVHLAVLFRQDSGSGVSVGFDLPTGLPDRPVTVGPGAPPGAIPDGAEQLTSEVVLDAPGLVGDVRVLLDELRHRVMDDLVISLEAPDGTVVRLLEGGRGTDVVDTVLADGGRPLSGAAGSYGGTYAPHRPLAALAGRAVAGTWRLRVRDVGPGEAGTLERWRLEVRPATCVPQVLATLTATPGTVLPGGTVTLDASGTTLPGDDEVVEVAWDPEGDGSFAPAGTARTLDHVFAERGAFEAAVRLRTRDGREGIARVLVPVTVPPVARLVAPGQADALEAVALDAGTSTDGDGRVVRFEWDLDGRSGFEVDGADVPTRSRTFARSGTYAVGVRVTDDLGATATRSHTIVVRNRAPVASLAELPAVAVLGEPLALDGSASADADGALASATFTLGDGSAPRTGTALTTSVVPTRSGVLTASLVVTDDEGAASAPSPSRSTLVTARPAARIAAPAGEIGLRAPAPLSGAGSSDDDGPPALAWDLDADGAFDDGAGATAAPAFARAGDHVVRLRATDVHGVEHVASAVVRVRNRAPVAVLTARPARLAPGEPVVLDASGSSDPDGAALAFRFDLDGDGRFETPAGTGVAIRSYPAEGLVPVAVQVTDADGGTAVARATVEVRAAAPAGPAPAPPAGNAPPTPGAPEADPVATPPALGAPDAARPPAPVALTGPASQRRAAVLRHGLQLRCAVAAQRCAVVASVGRADARRLGLSHRARGAVTIGRAAGRPGALHVRLTARARRALRRRTRLRAFEVVLQAQAIDAAGRRTASALVVVVRR